MRCHAYVNLTKVWSGFGPNFQSPVNLTLADDGGGSMPPSSVLINFVIMAAVMHIGNEDNFGISIGGIVDLVAYD